jgi:Na+/H+ antiporter NhaD/arsenite permease-like protein
VKSQDLIPAKRALKSLDYNTLVLLAGLFTVIAGITRVGVIDDISAMFVHLGGDSLFVTYTLIVWLSVLLSAFIDNIPYVAAMLPVVSRVATSLWAWRLRCCIWGCWPARRWAET